MDLHITVVVGDLDGLGAVDLRLLHHNITVVVSDVDGLGTVDLRLLQYHKFDSHAVGRLWPCNVMIEMVGGRIVNPCAHVHILPG